MTMCAVLQHPLPKRYVQSSIRAISPEAKTIEQKAEDVIVSFYYGSITLQQDEQTIASMLSCLNSERTYVSVGFFAQEIGKPASEIRRLALSNPSIFQKSYLKSSTGDDVFFKTRKFGRLIDIIKTYRHLCHVKFQR